jgi:hypothetical protein
MIIVVFILLTLGAVASVLGIVWSKGPKAGEDEESPYIELPNKKDQTRATLAISIGLAANTAASFISLFMTD